MERYRRVEPRGADALGEGAYGVVFRARDMWSGKDVALKKIRLETEDEGIPTTALREITLLSNLDHANVVRLENVVIRQFTYQMLSGLAYFSRNHQLKIADFGLARCFTPYVKPLTVEVITIWYRAPEILLGSNAYTCAVDLWSIGCIVAEIATNTPIFRGTHGEIEQMHKIFMVLGTPNPEIWPNISSLPYWRNNFPDWEPRPLLGLVPSIGEVGVSLLEELFIFDPLDRITAIASLQHPYIADLGPPNPHLQNPYSQQTTSVTGTLVSPGAQQQQQQQQLPSDDWLSGRSAHEAQPVATQSLSSSSSSSSSEVHAAGGGESAFQVIRKVSQYGETDEMGASTTATITTTATSKPQAAEHKESKTATSAGSASSSGSQARNKNIKARSESSGSNVIGSSTTAFKASRGQKRTQQTNVEAVSAHPSVTPATNENDADLDDSATDHISASNKKRLRKSSRNVVTASASKAKAKSRVSSNAPHDATDALTSTLDAEGGAFEGNCDEDILPKSKRNRSVEVDLGGFVSTGPPVSSTKLKEGLEGGEYVLYPQLSHKEVEDNYIQECLERGRVPRRRPPPGTYKG
eukprot:GSChrysophyteH1.ASY1.ANO1.809.1 assembled CDS